MNRRASRTAEASAAGRALHALHGREPKVFNDDLALTLAGPKWRLLLGSKPMAWLVEHYLFAWAMPLVGLHLVRARYSEDHLEAMLPQVLHYVVLGAGMNSFAARRPDLAKTLTVWELDHAGTQTTKKRRLVKAGLEPTHVRYVTVDFEVESVREALHRTGFPSDEMALFSWTGVTYYLTIEAVRQTLRSVASAAASGSEIIFDVIDKSIVGKGAETETGRRLRRWAKRQGEEILTGLDASDVESLLAETGFELAEVVDAAELRRRYFQGQPEWIVPWEHCYLVRARVR